MSNDLQRGKRIELYINGGFSDIALVDAVITDLPYIGSKVVTETDNIREVIVSRCSPGSVGFPSIIGNIAICEEEDDFGYRLRMAAGGTDHFNSCQSGQAAGISYSEFERMGDRV